MSDMGALPQFELPRSDDQNHTEPCKAKHHESNPENTQTAAHASSPQTAPGTLDFPHATVANAFDVPQPLPCEAEQPAIAIDFSPQQRVNGAA